MTDRSLVGQIARYGVSPHRNAREDRLTGILAAFFNDQHLEGLARTVALRWLDPASSLRPVQGADHLAALRTRLSEDVRWRCRARPQVSLLTASGRRRPDLEVQFDDGRGSTITLWVEVKHGTPPHTRQLSAYQEQHRRHQYDGAVLLLAPRRDYARFSGPQAESEIPPDVPRLTWEATGHAIGAFHPGDAVGAFLVADLLAYLTEEDLMDPTEFTDRDRDALTGYAKALAAVRRLCELAEAKVRDDRGQATGSVETQQWPSGTPRQFWWDAESPVASETRWLDWKLVLDAQDVFRDGTTRPCFFAGLSGEPGTIDGLPAGTERRLRERGFLVLRAAENGARYDFVLRQQDIDEIDAGELDVQARRLADWVLAAYADVEQLICDAA
jgi:hypothetical protein